MRIRHSTTFPILAALVIGCGAVFCPPPLRSQTDPPETAEAAGTSEQAPSQEAEAPAEEAEAEPPQACAGGVIKDDGTVETGYGFVPQAREGVYLQQFHSDEFPNRALDKVCLCWLKTKGDDDIEYEVVFYRDAGGKPADKPYAKILARARGLARSVKEAGAFVEVGADGVVLAPGISYIGARWNPSTQQFLFLCTDTGEETEKVMVFFKEDQAKGWMTVFQSRDPIFRPHRSVLVRALSQPAPAPAAPEAAPDDSP